jgi:indole-3-glycerol phosphate synthase
VSIPILRKDFIIDAYQLYESKAHGADVVLLIAAAIEKGRLHDLYDEAHAIGLESLVEVHSEEELRSLHLENIRLLGVNNRDLSTFETDLATSFRLKELVPPSVVLVSESGIATRGDVDRLMEHGIHAMLVGESLMRAPSPGKALAALLGRTEAMAR